jgi:hypothetical protein
MTAMKHPSEKQEMEIISGAGRLINAMPDWTVQLYDRLEP